MFLASSPAGSQTVQRKHVAQTGDCRQERTLDERIKARAPLTLRKRTKWRRNKVRPCAGLLLVKFTADLSDWYEYETISTITLIVCRRPSLPT